MMNVKNRLREREISMYIHRASMGRGREKDISMKAMFMLQAFSKDDMGGNRVQAWCAWGTKLNKENRDCISVGDSGNSLLDSQEG